MGRERVWLGFNLEEGLFRSWGRMSWWGRSRSLGNMARTGRWQLVGINEETSVGIARVQRQHAVVDVFLGTFGLVAGGQKSAGRIRGLAGFQSGGLGVVIVTIGVVFGDVLQYHSPVSFNINSSFDFGISYMRGAKIAFRSNPVGGIIRRRTLGSSGIVIIVKASFLISSDVFDQIISRLVSDIGVLLQENGVLRNFVGHFIVRIFGVF